MSRALFEEVEDHGEAGGRTTATGPGAAASARSANRRRVSVWLFVLAAMVVGQIVIGGLTRLTDSGLSITEWRPITGALPPLSEAAWLEEFELYRQIPEYQLQNRGMTLDEFKVIYWWEWGHRQWARLIGLVFIGGFAWFAWKNMMPVGWSRRILAIGGLGGVQAVIGWWMVTSGLPDALDPSAVRLDVSQYRLALHLGLAFVILGMLLWAALALRREEWDLLQARRRREARPLLAIKLFTALLGVQILSGAIVAGIDAGYASNTWPLMDGAFYPPGVPFDPFENEAAAQWTHRWLGALVLAGAVATFFALRRSAYAKTRLWGAITLGMTLVQLVLGIALVMSNVPLWLAALHQLGGVAIFAVAIHAWAQTAAPKEEKIAGAAA